MVMVPTRRDENEMATTPVKDRGGKRSGCGGQGGNKADEFVKKEVLQQSPICFDPDYPRR